MQVSTTHAAGQISVIAVHGQIDLQSAADLRDAVHAALAVSTPRIIVDLAGVDFCDSTGLSVFVYGHRQATDHGGFLRLAAPSAFLTSVLTVVGIAAHVPIFDSVSEAISATVDPLGSGTADLPSSNRTDATPGGSTSDSAAPTT